MKARVFTADFVQRHQAKHGRSNVSFDVPVRQPIPRREGPQYRQGVPGGEPQGNLREVAQVRRRGPTSEAAEGGGDVSPPPSRPSKYHNEAGDGFGSKKEARRYEQLRVLERAGSVRGLQRQVPFLLIPPQRIAEEVVEERVEYIADFTYDERTPDGWSFVVEDSKGMRTKDYVIKRKLMLHVHRIRVRET